MAANTTANFTYATGSKAKKVHLVADGAPLCGLPAPYEVDADTAQNMTTCALCLSELEANAPTPTKVRLGQRLALWLADNALDGDDVAQAEIIRAIRAANTRPTPKGAGAVLHVNLYDYHLPILHLAITNTKAAMRAGFIRTTSTGFRANALDTAAGSVARAA